MPIKIIDDSEREREPERHYAERGISRYSRPVQQLVRDPPPIAPFAKMCPERHLIVDSDVLYSGESSQTFQHLEQSERGYLSTMPIRVIEASQRLMPRSGLGKFAQLEEVKETMSALNNLPNGKAVQIDLDKQRYDILKKDGVKDPARSVVNVLRRKFLQGGLPFKAYASDDKTITVVREDALKKVSKK